jgi:hypothetical protein
MTLTFEQWTKIFDGIPVSFSGGVTLAKERADQYVDLPEFPFMLVSIITQGIPVSDIRRDVSSVLDPVTKVRTVKFSQNMKARISCVLEALDISAVESLASQFYMRLYREELGINPIEDRMQFRGADPPTNISPYRSDKLKKLVQRRAIDFFVEYEFSWTIPFATIQEFEVEVDLGSPPVIELSAQYAGARWNGINYSIDVILSR